MIRTLILSAALATGTVTGMTATAAAAPPAGHDHDRGGWGRYEVLVRQRGHWDSVGVNRDPGDATRVARQLERRGQDARVERVRGR